MSLLTIQSFAALTLVIIFASGQLTSKAESGDWRQLVVMKSTRDGAETLLGRSIVHGYIADYEVSNGNIEIEYADGQCKPGQYRAWSVPEWTIVGIDFTPFENPPKIEEIYLDRKLYKVVRESPDVPDLITYINETDGIKYTFEPDGSLNAESHFPGTEYDRLRCDSR